MQCGLVVDELQDIATLFRDYCYAQGLLLSCKGSRQGSAVLVAGVCAELSNLDMTAERESAGIVLVFEGCYKRLLFLTEHGRRDTLVAVNEAVVLDEEIEQMGGLFLDGGIEVFAIKTLHDGVERAVQALVLFPAEDGGIAEFLPHGVNHLMASS